MILTWVDAYVINKLGVNLRKSAGAQRTIVTVIPKDGELQVCEQVEDVAEGYRWVLAIYGEYVGFVAKSLIKVGKKPADPIPPVPIPDKRLNVGLHVAFNGTLEGFEDALHKMSIAGHPFPAILVVSDPGLCETIKKIDNRTIVFYRWVEGEFDEAPMSGDENSIPANGAQWYDKLFRRHSQATYADVHVLHNEIQFAGNGQSKDYAKRFNDFSMQMMRRATQDGKKVTFGNFMPGVPEAKHIEMMAESFAYAEANGHWLNYHPYTSDFADSSYFTIDSRNGQLTTPFFGMRPVEWVKNYPRLNVLGGEAAHYNSPRYRTDIDLINMLTEQQTMVAPYNTPLRRWLILYWTIRGQQHRDWKKDDVTPKLPLITDTLLRLVAP